MLAYPGYAIFTTQVAGINGCHAVTLVKENGADYVFKNSYGTTNSWITIPKQNAPARR